jgi:N-formylglutamate deformylase
MIADHPSFHLIAGTTPLLVSLPHCGELIPDELRSRYHPRALDVEDTDWHLHRLYAFAAAMGASVLQPRASRFVIDLNRPSDNAPMYPGANNTELCPTRFFTGEPIYVDGAAPARREIDQRIAQWWQPYHGAIATELARLKAEHGHAVIFDGHSIKSELPWLFEGRLPALNLGTVDGRSCAPSLREQLSGVLAAQDRYTNVVDGRFKGGYITRHYGRPDDGIHAVQLEMTWDCYMDETPPYAYRPDKAAQVQPLLRELLQAMRDWTPSR